MGDLLPRYIGKWHRFEVPSPSHCSSCIVTYGLDSGLDSGLQQYNTTVLSIEPARSMRQLRRSYTPHRRPFRLRYPPRNPSYL